MNCGGCLRKGPSKAFYQPGPSVARGFIKLRALVSAVSFKLLGVVVVFRPQRRLIRMQLGMHLHPSASISTAERCARHGNEALVIAFFQCRLRYRAVGALALRFFAAAIV